MQRPVNGSAEGSLAEFEVWMRLALQEAGYAGAEGEVPVGAVAVREGQLIASNHNRSIQLNDPTAHAEILVLRDTAQRLGNYRLNGVDLYVTIEPCPMCAGALVLARVRNLVFAARDEKGGGVVSKAQILTKGLLNHEVNVIEGVMAPEVRDLLRRFFSERR
ncbi:MAG: nucleoside deaminase [Acidobacteria bacterium]|nr:nucleoside deaminase [Acidobacteriota bacterium]